MQEPKVTEPAVDPTVSGGDGCSIVSTLGRGIKVTLTYKGHSVSAYKGFVGELKDDF